MSSSPLVRATSSPRPISPSSRGVGATPTFSTVVQLQPLRPDAPIFLAGGLGVITGHGGGRDRMTALVQGVAAFRLAAHEIAPFVQASKAFRAGERAELLFGIAHPLAPYRHKFF